MFNRSAVQLPLEPAGVPGGYLSIITDRNLYRTGYFYLAVSAQVALDDIRARFPRLAKIGSLLRMEEIIPVAVSGVPLRHAPTPPPQIRVLPGHVYFELDRSAPDWRDFASAPALGLHVAGDWPNLRLELWCVLRAQG
jgi:type VI secretion system protein ImpJ